MRGGGRTEQNVKNELTESLETSEVVLRKMRTVGEDNLSCPFSISLLCSSLSLSLCLSFIPPSPSDSLTPLCHFHIPANYCCRTLHFELDPHLIAHNWPLMSQVFGRSANTRTALAPQRTYSPSLSVYLSLCIISFSSFHVTERREGDRERGRGAVK